MLLKDIYPLFQVEDNNAECKLRLNEDSFSWLKTVAAFANSTGGLLFVGVKPDDFSLAGMDLATVDKQKQLFYQNARNRIQGYLDIKTDLLTYSDSGKDLYVLKISIAEATNKPVILMHQGFPMVFVRNDGFTSPATQEELVFMSTHNQLVKFDTMATDVPFSIDDFHDLDAFCFSRINKHLDVKDLESLPFFDKNQKLYRGSCLFRDACDEPNTKIVCSVYPGFTRGSDLVIASNSFEGNLIKAYQFMYEFVRARMNHGFLKTGNGRIDIDAFPERALFEAIINSLAHRDYFISGSQISLDIFKDRLVITSPGSYYQSGPLSPTYELNRFASRRRNEYICNVFCYCKAMEARGTGFERIISDYAAADDRHKPFIYSRNSVFSIVLPDLTYAEGVSIESDSISVIAENLLRSKYDLDILSYCYGQKRDVKDIAEHLGLANSSYLRNTIIGNLVKIGYLQSIKVGNALCFIANKEKVTLK